MITRSSFGNDLVEFLPPDAALDPAVPITFTQVVALHDGRVLLIFNTDRMLWEVPGGGIEPGETLDQCAIREFMEEACQVADELRCVGYALLRLNTKGGLLEYCALYTAAVTELRPFTASEECTRLTAWDGSDSSLDGVLSDWSREFIRYCRQKA